jgi:hypothetical protein
VWHSKLGTHSSNPVHQFASHPDRESINQSFSMSFKGDRERQVLQFSPMTRGSAARDSAVEDAVENKVNATAAACGSCALCHRLTITTICL